LRTKAKVEHSSAAAAVAAVETGGEKWRKKENNFLNIFSLPPLLSLMHTANE
jgi:hypothetical protein